MLLFHPQLLPTLTLTPFHQCVAQIPSESPQQLCRLLLALMQILSSSAPHHSNPELLAQVWARTLVFLCQSMSSIHLTLAHVAPANLAIAQHNFVSLLLELKETVGMRIYLSRIG